MVTNHKQEVFRIAMYFGRKPFKRSKDFFLFKPHKAYHFSENGNKKKKCQESIKKRKKGNKVIYSTAI